MSYDPRQAAEETLLYLTRNYGWRLIQLAHENTIKINYPVTGTITYSPDQPQMVVKLTPADNYTLTWEENITDWDKGNMEYIMGEVINTMTVNMKNLLQVTHATGAHASLNVSNTDGSEITISGRTIRFPVEADTYRNLPLNILRGLTAIDGYRNDALFYYTYRQTRHLLGTHTPVTVLDDMALIRDGSHEVIIRVMTTDSDSHTTVQIDDIPDASTVVSYRVDNLKDAEGVIRTVTASTPTED